jgi:hypothetical protein
LFFFFLSVSSSSFSATAADLSSSLSFHGFLSFLLTLFSLSSQEGLHANCLGSILETEVVATKTVSQLFFGKRKSHLLSFPCIYTPFFKK